VVTAQESGSGTWSFSNCLVRSVEEIVAPPMADKIRFDRSVGGSQERPWHFLRYVRKCLADTDGEAFWKNLIEHWSGFDLIPHEEFASLFDRFRGYSPNANLPDRVTIYRGQNDGELLGLSWTTDFEVAKEFAKGHRGLKNALPIIFGLEVTRDKIAFLCNDREESEIVLFEIPSLSEVEVIWEGE